MKVVTSVLVNVRQVDGPREILPLNKRPTSLAARAIHGGQTVKLNNAGTV
jgi:hypothetical protein